MKINHFNGRTMHIDISRRFYQLGDSSMAFKIIPSEEHKGLLLSNKLKKELIRDLKINQDYPKLSAICIYYLIKENLDIFDNLVICNDESYSNVKSYLDLLFNGNEKYFSKNITSLSELRRISGNSNIRSYADGIANTYRRKSSRPLRRQQKGVQLKVIEINYKKIKEKWEELNKKL